MVPNLIDVNEGIALNERMSKYCGFQSSTTSTTNSPPFQTYFKINWKKMEGRQFFLVSIDTSKYIQNINYHFSEGDKSLMNTFFMFKMKAKEHYYTTKCIT